MALSIADRAYVLQAGHFVLSGPAAELRETELIRHAYLGELSVWQMSPTLTRAR
jgi:branched-chain amino acid transport system ATP-binding protein